MWSLATLLPSVLVLTLGAELVVRYASRLALRWGLSPLFVGLTIVAAGTSAPELVTSVVAARAGQADIVLGNVVGSNVFNIGIILGVAALIRPLVVHFERVRADVLVATAVVAVPCLAVPAGGMLPRWLGAVLVLAFVGYTVRAYSEARATTVADVAAMAAPGVGAAPHGRGAGAVVEGLGIVAGLCLLVVGARYFVGAAVDLARLAGLSELVIGLTIVAAGTSMPELATSVVAAARGKTDLALGNVVGSNVFNMLVVLGTAALVDPPVVAGEVLRVDVPALLLAHLALIPVAYTGGRISRLEGAVLLGGYSLYAAYRVLA